MSNNISRRNFFASHRIGYICHDAPIGSIAYELNRPLEWNPIVQKFMNDDEANSKLHYEYRNPYKL